MAGSSVTDASTTEIDDLGLGLYLVLSRMAEGGDPEPELRATLAAAKVLGGMYADMASHVFPEYGLATFAALPLFFVMLALHVSFEITLFAKSPSAFVAVVTFPALLAFLAFRVTPLRLDLFV